MKFLQHTEMLIYGHIVSITFLSTYKRKARSLPLFLFPFPIHFVNASNTNGVIRSILFMEKKVTENGTNLKLMSVVFLTNQLKR